MIASSLREGDAMVGLLLKKEADVNAKSEEVLYAILSSAFCVLTSPDCKDYSGQVRIT